MEVKDYALDIGSHRLTAVLLALVVASFVAGCDTERVSALEDEVAQLEAERDQLQQENQILAQALEDVREKAEEGQYHGYSYGNAFNDAQDALQEAVDLADGALVEADADGW